MRKTAPLPPEADKLILKPVVSLPVAACWFMTEETLYSTDRLFGDLTDREDLEQHLPFLDRARAERARTQEEGARIALSGYLVARLVQRLLEGDDSPEQAEALRWQITSVRRHLDALPPEVPEVAHLNSLVDAATVEEGDLRASLRLGLTAYSHFLEIEGRYAEALDVLRLASATWKDPVAAGDFLPFALLAGRLHRLLSRWRAANTAYRAAMEAAQALGDRASELRAQLGRANVTRGEGNLPAALTATQAVLKEADEQGYTELVGLAYLDLGAVLERMGRGAEALRAQFRAFQVSADPIQRMRVLGDVGTTLLDIGALDAARAALNIVAHRPSSFVVQMNACIELMAVSSASGDRVGFERSRHLVRELEQRLTPTMAVDYRYKAGVGLGRFGAAARGEALLREALALAEGHGLHQWVFRLEDALAHLESERPDAAPAAAPGFDDVIAEVEDGIRELVTAGY